MDIIFTVLPILLALVAWVVLAVSISKLILRKWVTPQDSCTIQPHSLSRNLRYVAWLAAPAWIALAIELIGGWRFSKDTYASSFAIPLGGLYDTVVISTILMVVLSPVLALAGIIVTVQIRANARKRLLTSLLTLFAISLLISMFSCAWSCGGHPTWTSGYK